MVFRDLVGSRNADIRHLVRQVLQDGNDQHAIGFGHQHAVEKAMCALATDYVTLWKELKGKGYAVHPMPRDEQNMIQYDPKLERMEPTDKGLMPCFTDMYRYFFVDEVSKKDKPQSAEQFGPSPQSQWQRHDRLSTAAQQAGGFDPRVLALAEKARDMIEKHHTHASVSVKGYTAGRYMLIHAVDTLFAGLDTLCQKRRDEWHGGAAAVDWAGHAESRHASRLQATALQEHRR